MTFSRAAFEATLREKPRVEDWREGFDQIRRRIFGVGVVKRRHERVIRKGMMIVLRRACAYWISTTSQQLDVVIVVIHHL